MYGNERATLGGDQLKLIDRVWGSGEMAEYQADLYVPKHGVDGNYESLVCLSNADADEIDKFADELKKVAYNVRHQFDTEEFEVEVDEFRPLLYWSPSRGAVIQRVSPTATCWVWDGEMTTFERDLPADAVLLTEKKGS